MAMGQLAHEVRWPATVAGGVPGDRHAVRASDPRQDWEGRVREWWMAQAQVDLERALRGLREYSSSDLVMMGDAMRRIGALPTTGEAEVDEKAGTLAAIGFYEQGKVSRWLGALSQGDGVSDDTLLDVVVYGMMARFVQAFGSWSRQAVEAAVEASEAAGFGAVE